MKEGQESRSAQAEVRVLESGPEKKLLDSGSRSRETTVAQAADRMLARTGEIVPLFLDLARATGEEAHLEVAEAGAKHLADMWRSVYLKPEAIDGSTGSSLANGLPRAAFALGQAWKVTNNSNHQDAGLGIIGYVAELKSTASPE